MHALIKKIPLLGIADDMPHLLKKRIQFTNIFCVFLAILCNLTAIAGAILGYTQLCIIFSSYTLISIFILCLNYYGKALLSRTLFSPVTALYLVGASAASLNVLIENEVRIGILNVFLFRHFFPAVIFSVLIMLDRKTERVPFYSALAVSVFLMAAFFIAIQGLGVDFSQINHEFLGMGLSELFVWVGMLTVMGQILFLQSLNAKIETEFIKQNTELSGQKHEILTMNERLTEQKHEITMQRDFLETVHSDLMSSISYAQRIQNALLPPRELMQDTLPNHFILFKPRDMVSGDFYWTAEREGKFFWVCADCTGHGVPGAFMTVVGMNLLNQIIMEEGEDDPSTILLRLNRRLEEALRHDESAKNNVTDGMDLALVMVDTKMKYFQFAGAKRPLYFFPKGGVLEKVKGSRYTIGGGYSQGKIFETHTFNYTPGDRIYLFSDGYPDQYGGPKNCRMLTRNFQECISDLQNIPFEEHETVLTATLEEWQGHVRQTDDILVMGMELGTYAHTRVETPVEVAKQEPVMV